MRTFAILLALPILLSAALPASSTPTRVILHATTVNGPMDLFIPADGWVYIKPYQMPWLGPFTDAQLDAFGGQQAATAGVSFCATTMIHAGGQTFAVTQEVEIEEEAPSLEQAVSKAKDAIKAALPPGTFVTPCPVDSPANP